jgi:beta-lactamase class A
VSLLLRGSTLAVVGEPDRDGWQEALLPDGRRGYTKTGFLFHIPHSLAEDALRAQVTAMGRLYRDTHYLWGGKSPLGIDCSGLTFMAYRLSGVTVWRDAALKEGYPLRPIDFGAKKPGDLLFFPGHVALYLGEGRYLHSTAKNGSDGVVVNSLDPQDPDYRPDLPPRLLAVGSLF